MINQKEEARPRERHLICRLQLHTDRIKEENGVTEVLAHNKSTVFWQ